MTNTATHSTAATILGYLPLILAALQAAFSINKEVGHATAAQIVTDSITAGASIGGQIPEEHVKIIAQVSSALAPTVASLVQAASQSKAATA